MPYATAADRAAIEAERRWEDRDLPRTMWGLLSRTAEAHGARPAVSFQMFSGPTDPAETLTWGQLRAEVARVANALRTLGVGETDRVAILLPNCIEAVTVYLGAQTAGVVCPINPLLDAGQIAGILRETGAQVVVTLKSFPRSDVAQKVAAALADVPEVRHVLEVDLRRYLTGVKRLVVPFLRPKQKVAHRARVQDFHALTRTAPRDLAFDLPEADRTAALFHTGGTTGHPKIAQHRASGLIYNGWLGQRLLFSAEDVQITPLPMFHVFAAVVSLGTAIASGAHVVFPTPQGYRGEGVFDNFWKLVERWGVTFVIGVPTAFAALMQRPVDADISTLKIAFSGSAPLPLDLYRRFEEAAGVTICEGYGLTEATCLVAVNPLEGVKKVGSIGFAFPYTDLRILDAVTGAPCPTDTVGEICVHNPGVLQGDTYLEAGKNRDLYRRPDADGPLFLRTGDLGRIDADGYVWITGRAKDIIIRSGHNIDPACIEEALAGHPAVALVGAIGQPDAYAGEMPCVYVELVDGATVAEADLLAHARAHVPEPAARPKYIEILPELPKTAVGKIFKPDLRRRAIARVYDAALTEADCPARVTEVVEDRRRGLVARLRLNGATSDEVARILGPFTRPWEVQD